VAHSSVVMNEGKYPIIDNIRNLLEKKLGTSKFHKACSYIKGNKSKGLNREEMMKIIGQANYNNYAESLIRLVDMEEKYS